MQDITMLNYIKDVLRNMPSDWLGLTTHRLDMYNEEKAKTQFLEQFETLFQNNNAEKSALSELPTAYDYIRLGHPLSCVLEWAIANLNKLNPENVISFSSQTTPILAVLRTNLLTQKNTRIIHTGKLPSFFDAEVVKNVYGYKFELKQVDKLEELAKFDGSTILISQQDEISATHLNPNIDFFVNLHDELGSVLLVNGAQNESYISDIQHVRRRETIAMTPTNCLSTLYLLTELVSPDTQNVDAEKIKKSVLDSIKSITGTSLKPLVGSSGLSVQYAIMMGLIHDAQENHQGKAIKFIVPQTATVERMTKQGEWRLAAKMWKSWIYQSMAIMTWCKVSILFWITLPRKMQFPTSLLKYRPTQGWRFQI